MGLREQEQWKARALLSQVRARSRRARGRRRRRGRGAHARRRLGYPAGAPCDRVCLTAACGEVPAPLLEQLTVGGKRIAPIEQTGGQTLTLLAKGERGMSRQAICDVLYIPLRGQYGHDRSA